MDGLVTAMSKTGKLMARNAKVSLTVVIGDLLHKEGKLYYLRKIQRPYLYSKNIRSFFH